MLVLRLRDSVLKMGEELEKAKEDEARERENMEYYRMRMEEMKADMSELAQRELEAGRRRVELVRGRARTGPGGAWAWGSGTLLLPEAWLSAAALPVLLAACWAACRCQEASDRRRLPNCRSCFPHTAFQGSFSPLLPGACTALLTLAALIVLSCGCEF